MRIPPSCEGEPSRSKIALILLAAAAILLPAVAITQAVHLQTSNVNEPKGPNHDVNDKDDPDDQTTDTDDNDADADDDATADTDDCTTADADDSSAAEVDDHATT